MNAEAAPVSKITEALVKAQAAMTSPKFNRTNPHFKSKYADLTAIIDAVRKPLNDNGIAFTQQTILSGTDFVLLTTLRHVSGESIVSEWPLPPTASQQHMGSNLTYAKRYTLAAICGVSAEDDDDAEAGTSSPRSQAYKRDCISDAQLNELDKLVEERGADRVAFCRHLAKLWNIEIDTLADIPAAAYAHAITEVNRKPVKKS